MHFESVIMEKKRKAKPQTVDTVVISGVYTEIKKKMEETLPSTNVFMDPNISPAQYLEQMEMRIIQRIENIAQIGTLQDAVKLRANQMLLNKIRPDKSLRDSADLEESPYEAILRRLEHHDDE